MALVCPCFHSIDCCWCLQRRTSCTNVFLAPYTIFYSVTRCYLVSWTKVRFKRQKQVQDLRVSDIHPRHCPWFPSCLSACCSCFLPRYHSGSSLQRFVMAGMQLKDVVGISMIWRIVKEKDLRETLFYFLRNLAAKKARLDLSFYPNCILARVDLSLFDLQIIFWNPLRAHLEKVFLFKFNFAENHGLIPNRLDAS